MSWKFDKHTLILEILEHNRNFVNIFVFIMTILKQNSERVKYLSQDLSLKIETDVVDLPVHHYLHILFTKSCNFKGLYNTERYNLHRSFV